MLLDFSAAFNTTDRTVLLDRIENVGFRRTALFRLRSYLTDRYQCVYVNSDLSLHTKVTPGVPQGSVLSPLLFSIYTLPLGTFIHEHRISCHCSAENIQLYHTSKPDKRQLKAR